MSEQADFCGLNRVRRGYTSELIQSKEKAKQVAALVRAVAKGHSLSIQQICRESCVTNGSMYLLLSEHRLSGETLSLLKNWAKRYAVKK